MPRFVRALLALVLLSAAFSSHASLWFGDEDGVHRVNTDTNRADLRISSSEPIGLAVNSTDGSVWSLTRSRIAKYNAAGATVFSRTLSSYSDSIGNGRQLAVNAANGSAWITGERRLLHISATGALLSTAWSDATDMAVAQDGTLWILDEGDNELRRYANEGALLSRTHLSGVSRESRYIALDDTRGVFWLGGDHSLVKRSLANPGTVLKTITTSDEVNALSLDVQTGEVWVLGRTSFYGYRPDGVRFVSEYVGNDGVYDPETLAFDIGTQAVWIGHRNGLTRFTRTGNRIATIRADEVDTVAVSRAAVVIDPTISLVAPVASSTITNPRPVISFKYGANCAGTPCTFPPSYFATFSINATVNGAAVGSQFVFDPATGETRFTPATALPQGMNQVTGQAVDGTGRTSPVVSAQFTVDSVAPQFGAVTPASGTTFAAAAITIAGTVNDPAARVKLSGVAADQGAAFSFPVTLVAGVNNFTLTATDAAGNASTTALTYTLSVPNVPPTVSITAPADNASFTAPASFTVTANASDPDGTIAGVSFFSNGASIGTDTSAPYSVAVSALGNGTYALTAVATDNRGATTTSAPIRVTVGPANAPPVVTLQSPLNGSTAFAPGTISLRATASDPDGTIARVEFLRDGNIVATVNGTGPVFEATASSVLAGTFTFAARAVDNGGATTLSAPAQVTVGVLNVSINSPTAGAIVDPESVIVTGAFTGPANAGISVNGLGATVTRNASGGTYVVEVPLKEGANVLTAALAIPGVEGPTASVSVTTSDTAFPLDIVADPASGFAPLAVTFRLTNRLSEPVAISFNGSGLGTLPGDSGATITVTFSASTVVTFGATASGASATRRIAVEAINRAALDAQLRAMWSSMNTALAAGDKATAMSFLTGGARDKYGPVFDKLMPQMASIVASYSAPQLVSLATRVGEYGVNRTVDGVNRVFLIYFIRDEDGTWRLDAM